MSHSKLLFFFLERHPVLHTYISLIPGITYQQLKYQIIHIPHFMDVDLMRNCSVKLFLNQTNLFI